jgi:hypothetical protein
MLPLADFSLYHWSAKNATLAILQEPRATPTIIGNQKEEKIQPIGDKEYEQGKVQKIFRIPVLRF